MKSYVGEGRVVGMHSISLRRVEGIPHYPIVYELATSGGGVGSLSKAMEKAKGVRRYMFRRTTHKPGDSS